MNTFPLTLAHALSAAVSKSSNDVGVAKQVDSWAQLPEPLAGSPARYVALNSAVSLVHYLGLLVHPLEVLQVPFLVAWWVAPLAARSALQLAKPLMLMFLMTSSV